MEGLMKANIRFLESATLRISYIEKQAKVAVAF